MTKKNFQQAQIEWKEMIARVTKDNLTFFSQPENDLQTLITHLRKYQAEEDLKNYINTCDALFNSPCRWGFCGVDLSQLDLSSFSAKSLARITFDSGTIWPSKDKLPKGFDPTRLLKNAKTYSGLGIDDLHKQGISGQGVKVAYIDKGFDLEHAEFKNRKIEYINFQSREVYDFHGYAVASRLIGKNIGTAPDAEMLYFNCDGEHTEKYILTNLQHELKALDEVLTRLQNGEKIVAVGVSASITYHIQLVNERQQATPEEVAELTKTYEELKSQLKDYDCTIIDSSQFWASGFSYAYKTDPFADDSNLENYAQYGYDNRKNNGKCSVIETNKVIPFAFTKDGYKYENLMGCASWSIPQIVGLYCLTKQVNPNITYDQFVKLCHTTAYPTNANDVQLINPPALIKEVALLKSKDTQNCPQD